MKYKLLKDLPLAKAGTEVYLERNSTITSKIHANGVYDLGSIVDATIPEWLEEVKEHKTIYDLGYDECYWYLDTQNTVHNTTTNYPDKQRWKGNEHNRCFITEREAKRNKLLRELATRTDKWLPIIGDKYYSYHLTGCDSWNWQGDNTDMIKYHSGLVFRNVEEYNKYITEEAKDLLFKI